ncbi:MAG: hypothetical protein U0441_17455 [Polyangiaceae bacterium]
MKTMTTGSLRLTLVNQSNDANNSTVLIFQRNAVAGPEETPVAWEVIENLGRGWTHVVNYEFDLAVGVTDSYGNASSQLPAAPGQLFSVYSSAAGNEIKPVGSVPNNSSEIWIRNDLSAGATSACIYRNGKLLATKTGVAPGQSAAFRFNPTIYIGALAQWQANPGQVLDSAILSTVNHQISLAGITGAATILMSGGGPGRPFIFTLQPG